MKKSILARAFSLVCVFVGSTALFSGSLAAQTTLISPSGDGGFENGATFAANGWSVATTGPTNQWVLGTVPAGFNNRVAFVSNDGGTSWNYNNAATSVVHFWRDVTFPAGETNIQLSINWQALGETSSWDALMVSLAPVTYTPVAGTTSLGTAGLAAPAVTIQQFWNVTGVQTANITLPASLVGNCSGAVTLRLIFTWKNDSSGGSAPPSAVDNISLTSIAGAGPLTGTFNVGPGGAYATLTAAVADVVARGASGPIVLQLQSDYTSGGETYPIVLNSYCNASATNTVTIRPAAGATGLSIAGGNTGPTMDINTGNWWRIDGRPGGVGTARELTISNTATGGQALRFINDGSNNIVNYTILRGVNTSTASGVVVFSTTTFAGGNDNHLIDNCDIRDGATNPLNGVYASGTTTTLPQYNNNNAITNCNIFNFFGTTSSHAGIL
ncbi:MAG: hypothetical protein ACR2K1_14295, partial [Saprospiraceae bacterium]